MPTPRMGGSIRPRGRAKGGRIGGPTATGDGGGGNDSRRGAKMLRVKSKPFGVRGVAKRGARLVEFASGFVSGIRRRKSGRLLGRSLVGFGVFEKPIKSQKDVGFGAGFGFALSSSLRKLYGCFSSSLFISTS